MTIKELKAWKGQVCRITTSDPWRHKESIYVGKFSINDNGDVLIYYPMLKEEVNCGSMSFNAKYWETKCSKVYRRTKEKWEIEMARFNLFLMESDFERYGTIHPSTLY